MTLDQVIKAKIDQPIFLLRDDTQPKRLDGTFKKIPIDAGLGIGTEEKMRTLYSFRQFYATQQLTAKHPISIALPV